MSSSDKDLPLEDPLLGRLIAGKFCLRECIGIGASGSVYRADQSSLGRTVAIKVLRPELANDPRFIRRFHDEARAASRLNHPNVVSVIDFGETEDGLLYLAMEFLRGTTLTDLLRSEQLGVRRIVEIVRQILSALEEAHEGGVVHADLKSDNIMVEPRRGGWDLVKVVDFGIARLTGGQHDEDNSDKSICGTPEYMAPEVIRGNDPTPAADIYAVGIMLYEIFVGYTPFSGSPTMDVLHRQMHEAPVPPSQRGLVQQIPPQLEALILRALAKEANQRFSSASHFASELAIAATEAGPENFECRQCGTSSPAQFKFCPECGATRRARSSHEIELSLDDVGHEELWSDDIQTADIEGSRLQTAEIDAYTFGIDDQATPSIPLFPLPLVGRGDEQRAIQILLTQSQASVLHIYSEQGMGGSRLLLDALHSAESTSPIYLCKADPTGLALPFHPIRAAVAAILQLSSHFTDEDIEDSLHGIGLNSRDLPGILQLFHHEDGEIWALSSKIRKRELFASTLRIFRAAAKQFSAVLVFEDLDRYDQPSRELIEHLLDNLRPDTMLRVILSSSDKELAKRADIRQLLLPALDDADLRQLLDYCAGRGQANLISLAELRQNTHGCPLHVEQLLHFAHEGGDPSQAPTSLADLIAARTDFLPSSAKRFLQSAATYGMLVDKDDLYKLLGNSLGPIERDAAEQLLILRNFLRDEQDTLAFPNQFVRDVIHESTPRDVRQKLHASARLILAEHTTEAAILGNHAENAGDLEAAANLLASAGDRSIQQLDDRGAAALLNRALRAIRQVYLRNQDASSQLALIETSVKLADSLRVCGQINLARGILSEAENYCATMPALRAQLRRASAKIAATEHNFEKAISLYREAIAIAIPILATDILTEAYLDLATMLLRQGDTDTAISELEEAVDMITMGEGPSARKTPPYFWRIVLRLTQLKSAAGQLPVAKALGAHALRIAQEQKSSFGAARASATLAGVLEASGDSKRASSLRRRAIEDMRRLGDRRSTAELLLAGSRPSQTIQRISADSVREARLLAEEVGWTEGVLQARRAQEHI